jgi:uncharacterized protein
MISTVITRDRHISALRKALRQFPVVALLGQRQVGKSTLARALLNPDDGRYFDLERSDDLARLADPLLTLSPLRGLVVIDEVQRRPDLFPTLRVLADRRPVRARFLVLGSAAPELLRQSAESLAGRILYYELPGFSTREVGAEKLDRLWLRGSFPDSFLAKSDAASLAWRRTFVRSYLERDLPALGSRVPPATLERFWSMLAHYHAQSWNGSEIGRSMGMSDTTVRGYLDLLAGTYAVTILQPWFENVGKRQVKSPRVMLADSGLLHTLLGIRTAADLERHPKVGASWEGFIAHQLFEHFRLERDERYFWRTATGAELDILTVRGRERLGFEIKRTTAPAFTPSMRIALADLRLKHLWVVHAGKRRFQLAPKVTAIPATEINSL